MKKAYLRWEQDSSEMVKNEISLLFWGGTDDSDDVGDTQEWYDYLQVKIWKII